MSCTFYPLNSPHICPLLSIPPSGCNQLCLDDHNSIRFGPASCHVLAHKHQHWKLLSQKMETDSVAPLCKGLCWVPEASTCVWLSQGANKMLQDFRLPPATTFTPFHKRGFIPYGTIHRTPMLAIPHLKQNKTKLLFLTSINGHHLPTSQAKYARSYPRSSFFLLSHLILSWIMWILPPEHNPQPSSSIQIHSYHLNPGHRLPTRSSTMAGQLVYLPLLPLTDNS